jgi:hypothetical protein
MDDKKPINGHLLEKKHTCGARTAAGHRCTRGVPKQGDRCQQHLGKGELIIGGDPMTMKMGDAMGSLPGSAPQEVTNKPAKDWLVALRETGEWRAVSRWLWENRRWLTDQMASFAYDMSEEGCPGPSPRQLALLISLRGGVECLMQWDSMPVPSAPPQLTDDGKVVPFRRYLH